MKQAIAWQIGPDKTPRRLEAGGVSLERDLEDWIDHDVGIVADDVLVIGRQVRTSWGTILDVLAVDEAGNLVIVELKRDQTLRETVAQAIEYAAWASRLGHVEVMQIAAERFGSTSDFAKAFEEEFGSAVPETLNSLQRILIVAPTIDDTTSFIIEYLAEAYRVPINAVSFDIFGPVGDQLLVRHFVIEESTALPPPIGAKTRQTETWDDVMTRARDFGVEDLVHPFKALVGLFRWDPWFNKGGWTYYARDPAGVSTLRVILKPGAVSVTLRADNLSAVFGKPEQACQMFIDAEAESPPPIIGKGFTRIDFIDPVVADGFAGRFREFVAGAVPVESLATAEPANNGLGPTTLAEGAAAASEAPPPP